MLLMSVSVLWGAVGDCTQNDKRRFQLKMAFMNENDPALSYGLSVTEPVGVFFNPL